MTRWICFNHQKSIIFDSSSDNPRCPECKCADIGVYSGARLPTPIVERKEKGAGPVIEKEINMPAKAKTKKVKHTLEKVCHIDCGNDGNEWCQDCDGKEFFKSLEKKEAEPQIEVKPEQKETELDGRKKDGSWF